VSSVTFRHIAKLVKSDH